MKWLLTVGKEVGLEELRARLEPLDSTIDTSAAVPLDDEDCLVPAEGPPDLPARLADAGLNAVKAYPNSELELFDPR